MSKRRVTAATRPRALRTSVLEAALAHQIALVGLPAPSVEYRFDADRRWRFDFAYPDRRIGIECEGGTWTNGRHTRGAGYAHDCEKYTTAALAGWLVIRVTEAHIKSGMALKWIEAALQARTPAEALAAMEVRR